MRTIVAIARQEVWQQALQIGEYTQSTVESTLADVGFIHCSFPDQTIEIANRHFSDRDGLMLLLIDEYKVKASVKHEGALSGRAGTFPHIYGPLNVDAVYATVVLEKDKKGKFISPKELEIARESAKIFEIALPEYRANVKPDYLAVGPKLDKLLEQHFVGQDIIPDTKEFDDILSDSFPCIISVILSSALLGRKMISMNNTPSFTIILFVLPDKRIVLQRRTKDAPYAPGKLGIFGGWVEEGETPDECLMREIKEETSLDATKLNVQSITDYILPKSKDFDRNRHFYLYYAHIDDLNFEVYEGDGAEAFELSELQSRTDLTGSALYTFKNILTDERVREIL